jgi:hypothetical protein
MVTDDVMNDKCPRCGSGLRQFPEDRGALSRSDETTRVCGPCGLDEAFTSPVRPTGRRTLPTWIDHRFVNAAAAARALEAATAALEP